MIVLALAGSVLSIDGSFLVVFISILVLIFILNRTLFKPINQVLDERERLGAGRMSEAKQLLAQYDQRLNGYEQQIQTARAEAYQFMEAQRREAQGSRAEMIAQIKGETASQVAAAREDISKQTADAKTNLEGEARAMAAVISSQILHRPVSGGGN
ncbi:MAG: ATP synthase F0 subunit B [Acidobacteria bacterium]|nr:ATP synthase F0 subunit B [Acidobacteriota bacterium]